MRVHREIHFPFSKTRFRHLRYGRFFRPLIMGCTVVYAANAAPFDRSDPVESSLSLNEALSIAEDRSLELEAQRLAARAARHMGQASQHLPDPELSVFANNIPANGPDAFELNKDFMTMRSVGISQTYPLKSKRFARSNLFEAK